MAKAAKKINMLAVKDPEDNLRIHKHQTPDLPMRMLIVGASEISGKSTIVDNLTLRPYGPDDHDGQDFYYHDFDGDHIFLISPSAHTDAKLQHVVEFKKIPAEQVMDEYKEEYLNAIISHIEKTNKKEHQEGIFKHWLVIMDDCSFGGSLRSHIHGAISKLFCNMRHHQVSTILTSQKYADILPTCRTNASAMILFELPEREMQQFIDDSLGYSSKEVRAKFLKATEEKHSYMVYLRNKPRDRRFLDQHWLPLP